jgi:hypothetical protein
MGNKGEFLSVGKEELYEFSEKKYKQRIDNMLKKIITLSNDTEAKVSEDTLIDNKILESFLKPQNLRLLFDYE